MPDHSLKPANATVIASVEAFREAARLVQSGDVDGARRIIAALDDAVLRQHWNDTCDEPTRRGAPSTIPPHDGERAARNTPPTVITATFERDGWRCRWCGTPVVSPEAFKRMHATFPAEFPRDATNDGRHGLILAASASHDHVLPLARGGDENAENLVTACWPCQFGRFDWTLDEVGLRDPRERPPIVDDWDGVAWFR
jgi:5-methylcytosine-specific restriction endonuclease McrA